MEITRTTDILVETKRRFVILQPQGVEPTFCAECGGTTLTAEQAAASFGINQRAIFRFIEAGVAHFAEIQTGAVMICASSLAAILNNDGEKQISGTTGDKD